MKTSTKLIATSLMMLITAACGSAAKRDESAGTTPNNGAPGSGSTGSGSFDAALSGDEAASQIDDAVSTASADVDQEGGAAAALALAGVDSKHDVKRFRECKVDGDKAVVTLSRSVDNELTYDGKVRSGSAIYKLSHDETRTWSKAGGAIECAADLKHAKLSIPTMQGVALDVTFSNQVSKSVKFTNVKKKIDVERGFAWSASGTRHADWLTVASAGNVVTIDKKVTFASERKLSTKDAQGNAVEIDRSVAVDANDPLMVELERAKDTLMLQKRTIKSGTIVATKAADGSRHVTKFTNAAYAFSSDGKCSVSGTIHGEIYDSKDAATPSKTYDIDLAAGEITFSDGTVKDVALPDCSDDSDKGVTEAATKDAVKS